MDIEEEDENMITRKVVDSVQNDSLLIERTATEIARALNLEGNNRTLGRKFVRMALASDTIDTFKEKSLDYGNIRKDILVEIFHKVKQKYNNMIVQLRDQSDVTDADSMFGFSGKTDTLQQLRPEVVLRGGLMPKSRGGHTFKKPNTTDRNVPILGLERGSYERDTTKVPSTIVDQDHDDNPDDNVMGSVVVRKRNFRNSGVDVEVENVAKNDSRVDQSQDSKSSAEGWRAKRLRDNISHGSTANPGMIIDID